MHIDLLPIVAADKTEKWLWYTEIQREDKAWNQENMQGDLGWRRWNLFVHTVENMQSAGSFHRDLNNHFHQSIQEENLKPEYHIQHGTFNSHCEALKKNR